MHSTPAAALFVLILAAGCSAGGGQRVVVDRVGPDDVLKLRAGPGLEYRVLLGLPDGTGLIRRTCVTELGQLWCRVSLAEAPRVSGYVSADYLTAP